jgi:phospholipid/cholesterol/gamma-HCH transport system ATP-binding protein
MIEYDKVWKSFGDNRVLKGISLDVREGETFFVLGQTGAGKTVMVRLLVGLLHADSGAVRIDGEDITAFSEQDFQRIRKKCGMVFQLPTLFDSMTVFENIAFGLRRLGNLSEEEIGERVKNTLEDVELDFSICLRLPHELSFGEQKRVGLARTVILSPRYVLYDEPTTGLDPFTADRINDLVLRLNRKMGATAIVVSHDLLSMNKIADRVGLLYKGEFRFVGPVKDFNRSDDPVVAEFRGGGEA